MKSNKESMKSNKPSKLGLKKLTLMVLSESEQAQIVGGMGSGTCECCYYTDIYCYTF
jgi:hypothetical protein